jgi:hypothetical protein
MLNQSSKARAKGARDVTTIANKNQAAVMLGRLGGIKGGPARAAKLGKRRRSEIARMAAQVRWSIGGKKRHGKKTRKEEKGPMETAPQVQGDSTL